MYCEGPFGEFTAQEAYSGKHTLTHFLPPPSRNATLQAWFVNCAATKCSEFRAGIEPGSWSPIQQVTPLSVA